ncbi:hypothetical protein [Streptomyces sp. NPDC021356]|uniref:hypothetical protein n=1 Tax=Streptomyces sp. NPDC021356 TaxID=3154900 RepID=UPI0033CF9A96
MDIRRADRITARFTVDLVVTVAKDRFPAEAVYGPTPAPELRLITCGGAYTGGRGYDGDVVVFAHYSGSGGGGRQPSGRRRPRGSSGISGG